MKINSDSRMLLANDTQFHVFRAKFRRRHYNMVRTLPVRVAYTWCISNQWKNALHLWYAPIHISILTYEQLLYYILGIGILNIQDGLYIKRFVTWLWKLSIWFIIMPMPEPSCESSVKFRPESSEVEWLSQHGIGSVKRWFYSTSMHL